jgi:hypothetical protein
MEKDEQKELKKEGIEDREQNRVEDREKKQDVKDPFDNGWYSRKLHFSLLVLFTIVGLTFAGNWLPGVAAQLGTAVGGILGVLALYLGGNIASKWSYTNISKVMAPLRKVAPDPSGSPANEPPTETG